MIEVNGLFCSCVEISHETPAAQGCVRHFREIRWVGLVAINTACMRLLCFMYSLFVGHCRKSPRLFLFAFWRF
jgi:hypothetical protein